MTFNSDIDQHLFLKFKFCMKNDTILTLKTINIPPVYFGNKRKASTLSDGPLLPMNNKYAELWFPAFRFSKS